MGDTGYVIGCADPGATVAVEWHGERASPAAGGLGVYVALFRGCPEPPRPDPAPAGGAYASSLRLLAPEEAARHPDERPRMVAGGSSEPSGEARGASR